MWLRDCNAKGRKIEELQKELLESNKLLEKNFKDTEFQKHIAGKIKEEINKFLLTSRCLKLLKELKKN